MSFNNHPKSKFIINGDPSKINNSSKYKYEFKCITKIIIII